MDMLSPLSCNGVPSGSQIRVVRQFTANRNIEDMLKRLFRAHYNMT